MPKPALLIVGVQNDLCPGGALPVPGGDEVVGPLNRYIDLFAQANLPVYAARDWHPKRTKHFVPDGGPWPAHCVQESFGAAFHPDLQLPSNAEVLSIGVREDDDVLSCFQGTTADGTPFGELLQAQSIHELFIGGLSTETAILATVLDARRHRFGVTVLMDAVRGGRDAPSDVQRAVDAMAHAGALCETFETVHPRLVGPFGS